MVVHADTVLPSFQTSLSAPVLHPLPSLLAIGWGPVVAKGPNGTGEVDGIFIGHVVGPMGGGKRIGSNQPRPQDEATLMAGGFAGCFIQTHMGGSVTLRTRNFADMKHIDRI